MKFSFGDFQAIRTSAVGGFLLLSSGGGSVFVAHQELEAARIEYVTAQTQRRTLETKLQHLRSEERTIQEKIALYHHLSTRGVLGEEQRLDAVELFKTLRDSHRLIDLHYEFEPQRTLVLPSQSGISVFSSPTRVQLTLLHEEDLIRFLDALRLKARALIQVRSCQLFRHAREGFDLPSAGTLRAACHIDWISLREAPNDKEKR